jgi:3'-phosphoadenosine 5'-phosphosulfate sulfotransferase (PAPS reductase)/FAD synthetase
MKHIVCYSGGHSSALVAIEVARKYGVDDLVLLNHDINPSVEEKDIKRFKLEVAEYLGIPVTYANHKNWDTKDQFDVVIDARAFKVGNGTALCTHRLKTEPFDKWLEENVPDKDCIIYYGFDKNEIARVQRRSGILGARGFKTDYPLALWPERTIYSTKEIGIEPPNTYNLFRHANCTGCLKAGRQHWYIVYLNRKDLWEKAKKSEEVIGYSILKDTYLEELEEMFESMNKLGITTTEHEDGRTFFARVRKHFRDYNDDQMGLPCECFV